MSECSMIIAKQMQNKNIINKINNGFKYYNVRDNEKPEWTNDRQIRVFL